MGYLFEFEKLKSYIRKYKHDPISKKPCDVTDIITNDIMKKSNLQHIEAIMYFIDEIINKNDKAYIFFDIKKYSKIKIFE